MALAPLAPNPASNRLVIGLTLANNAPSRLEIFDVSGRRVGVKEVGSLGAGQHMVTFDEAASWPPGIYFVRLEQGPRTLVTRACIVH